MASPEFVLTDVSPYTPSFDPFTAPGGDVGIQLDTMNSLDTYGTQITDRFSGPLEPGSIPGVDLATILPGSEGLQSDQSGNVRSVSTVRTSNGGLTSIFSGVLSSLLAPKGQSAVSIGATGLRSKAPAAVAPSVGTNLTIILISFAGLAVLLFVLRPKSR